MYVVTRASFQQWDTKQEAEEDLYNLRRFYPSEYGWVVISSKVIHLANDKWIAELEQRYDPLMTEIT